MDLHVENGGAFVCHHVSALVLVLIFLLWYQASIWRIPTGYMEKKTMWSILENGMSALVSIWLSKMPCWLLCCVSLLSNSLGKSFRGLYIDGLWTRNVFPLYSCPRFILTIRMYYVPTFVASKRPTY